MISHNALLDEYLCLLSLCTHNRGSGIYFCQAAVALLQPGISGSYNSATINIPYHSTSGYAVDVNIFRKTGYQTSRWYCCIPLQEMSLTNMYTCLFIIHLYAHIFIYEVNQSEFLSVHSFLMIIPKQLHAVTASIGVREAHSLQEDAKNPKP